MKKLLIIDTYPINEAHEKALVECIDSLNSPNLDIMVVSHAPISKAIQEKVKYVIYDTENILLPKELTPYWWMGNNDTYCEIYDNGHSITICKNIKTSVSLAKTLGYDFFYFIESDNIFSDDDKTKLIGLSDITLENGKEMFVFKQNYGDDEYIYETLIFGGKPSFLLENMLLPTTVDEYINFRFKPTLELSFYEMMNKHEDKLFVLNIDSTTFFNESTINKFSQNEFKCQILKTNHNTYILFVVNDARNTKTIDITINNDIFVKLDPGSWYYLPITHNVDTYNVTIIDGDYKINKNFNITNIENYDDNGFFEFRTN